MKKIIVTSSIIATFFVACKSKKETASTAPFNCSNKTLTYNTDIKPIIESSCTRCHNTNEKAGYNFFKVESVKKAALNGKLLGTIKHQEGFSKMPKMGDKLDNLSIDKIECWIKNGMNE